MIAGVDSCCIGLRLAPESFALSTCPPKDALPTPPACVARLSFALRHCTSGAFYGPLPLHVFVADPSTSGGGDSGSGLVRPRGGDGACATGELLKLFGLHAGAGGDALRHQRAPGPSVD